MRSSSTCSTPLRAPTNTAKCRCVDDRGSRLKPAPTFQHPNEVNPRLGALDVFRARALRALADRKGDLLTLPHRIERRAGAGGLVEEVFRPIRGCDEAETLVGDALDGAGSCCHSRDSSQWPMWP